MWYLADGTQASQHLNLWYLDARGKCLQWEQRSSFHFQTFFTKGLYTFIKKQAIRPTFSLCSITKRKIFKIFETLWFLWLTDYEHQYLLFCRTCSFYSFQPRDISFQEAAILGATDSDWPVTFLNKVLQGLFQI